MSKRYTQLTEAERYTRWKITRLYRHSDKAWLGTARARIASHTGQRGYHQQAHARHRTLKLTPEVEAVTLESGIAGRRCRDQRKILPGKTGWRDVILRYQGKPSHLTNVFRAGWKSPAIVATHGRLGSRPGDGKSRRQVVVVSCISQPDYANPP